MLEPTVFRGMWWLPGTGKEVPGSLTLSRDDFTLTLTGSLGAPVPPVVSGEEFDSLWTWTDIPIVLGLLEDGETRVTLAECVGSAPRPPFQAKRENWHPGAVLVGDHLDTPEQLLFDKATLRFEHPLLRIPCCSAKAGPSR